MSGAGAWIRYGDPLQPGQLDFAAEHYRAAILQPWELEAAAQLRGVVREERTRELGNGRI